MESKFILVLLALTSLSVSFVNAGPQQGRGRSAFWQSLPRPPQVQPPPLDRESMTILQEIFTGGKHLGGSDARGIRFDVAEDASKFSFDETPVFPDGMPAYGNPFITQGYIYPFGTLNGTNGVKPDGSPEFPNKVLGRWFCRGWFIGDGAHTQSGPMVMTHQLYDFGSQIGRATIATDGYELADVQVQFSARSPVVPARTRLFEVNPYRRSLAST